MLAEMLRQTGEYGLAAGVCEEAQLFGPSDQQRAMIHRTLGVISLSADKAERGGGFLKLAIGDALRAGDREFLCQCYLDFIIALDKQGKQEQATRELREGIDIITMGDGLRTTNGPNRLWRLGLRLAERLFKDDDLDRARETAQDALALTTRIGNPHARGRISALLAQICEAGGDRGAALRYRSNAIDAMRTLGDRRSTAELLIETARTSAGKKDKGGTDAQSALRLAHKLALEVGWDEGAAMSRP